MKAALRFHKIAAWVWILMGMAHLAGHIFSELNPPGSSQEAELMKTMQGFPIPDPLFGTRSMLQIYHGLSLTFSAMSILWGLACLAAVKGGGSLEFLRRMMWLNTAACAALLALCLVYFILPPTTFVAAALVCALLAQRRLPGNKDTAAGV